MDKQLYNPNGHCTALNLEYCIYEITGFALILTDYLPSTQSPSPPPPLKSPS